MEIKGKGRQDEYGGEGSDGDGDSDGSVGDGVQEQYIPPNDRKLDNLQNGDVLVER